MEKLISCCGLNCAACEARTATLSNDDEQRKAVAEKWRVDYNAKDITYQMINCTGCREAGPKINHWSECGIRKCAESKGYNTCGDCSEMESCEIVAHVHKFVPEAITNLRSLN
jgi:hypothetical protein